MKRPRSGLARKHGITLTNSPGTIDSDYRGEVQVLMINLGDAPHVGKGRARHGVDVDPPLVGLLDVPAAGVPGVELDRRHLHRPHEVGRVLHAQLVDRMYTFVKRIEAGRRV